MTRPLPIPPRYKAPAAPRASARPSESAEEALQRRLKDLLARPDLPAFNEHIQQILRCTGDDSTSIRHVTGIIMREVSVSLKLLRTANSPLYNRSGRPILSVSHAASLLGMHGIRDLAAGIMLFQHFRDKSPSLKELMLLSLMTANHTRECANALQYPRLEEAYLCGMFRNLGEVLVACYYPTDYTAILGERTAGHLPDRLASRKVLRFTYEDLGRSMIEHWGLPETVRHCLTNEVQPGTVKLSPNAKEFLPVVSTFGHQLTECTYRSDPLVSRRRVADLREAFAASLGLSKQQLDKVMETSLAETGETARLLQIPVDELRLERQLQGAMKARPEAELQDAPVPPAAENADPADTLTQLKRQMASATWDLNEVLMGLLEEAFRSGPFDQVLFGLVDPLTNTIHGRLGLGDNIDILLDRFRFPLSLRGGPVALAILRKHDLFAFTPAETRFDRSGFARELGSGQFALCPVIVDGAVIGCLYCNRWQSLTGNAREVESRIRELRDVAALAIERARGISPASS
ncbi:MAG: HDOD domain-containing protein [Bryobacterales bacterium]|nr:HDOD domain-containing protein [Bryobacterales bacterium]